MVSRTVGLVLASFCVGCGGSIEQPRGDALEGGSIVGARVDAEASVAVGEEDAAFPPAEAASDARDGHSILSGTRYCQSSEDCLGLECDFGPTPFRGACVVYCARDEDCEARQRCFGAAAFAASCFAICTSPAQCAFGFDCVDYLRDGAYTCLPTPWVVAPRD
jgi:hypothetical protein